MEALVKAKSADSPLEKDDRLLLIGRLFDGTLEEYVKKALDADIWTDLDPEVTVFAKPLYNSYNREFSGDYYPMSLESINDYHDVIRSELALKKRVGEMVGNGFKLHRFDKVIVGGRTGYLVDYEEDILFSVNLTAFWKRIRYVSVELPEEKLVWKVECKMMDTRSRTDVYICYSIVNSLRILQ